MNGEINLPGCWKTTKRNQHWVLFQRRFWKNQMNRNQSEKQLFISLFANGFLPSENSSARWNWTSSSKMNCKITPLGIVTGWYSWDFWKKNAMSSNQERIYKNLTASTKWRKVSISKRRWDFRRTIGCSANSWSR